MGATTFSQMTLSKIALSTTFFVALSVNFLMNYIISYVFNIGHWSSNSHITVHSPFSVLQEVFVYTTNKKIHLKINTYSLQLICNIKFLRFCFISSKFMFFLQIKFEIKCNRIELCLNRALGGSTNLIKHFRYEYLSILCYELNQTFL
jgi:hypothetical protein